MRASHPKLAHPSRLQALQSTGLMDTGPEPCFDRFTRMAARLLSVPVALLSLVDDQRQFFKSCVGLPTPWDERRQTPLSHSFCQHVVVSEQPLVVSDAREHETLKTNLAIRDLGVVAYLGVPVKTAEGQMLGSFCVIDAIPRAWSEHDLATMQELAECVQTEIELRRLLGQQTSKVSRLEVHGQHLTRQVEVTDLISQRKSEFLARLGHELRNPLSPLMYGIQLLCDGQLSADETQDVYQLLDDQVRQVARLVEDMLDLSRIEQGKIEIHEEAVDIDDVVQLSLQAVHRIAEENEQAIDVQLPDGPVIVPGDRDRLVQVLTNLLTNACRYTPCGGKIRVHCVVRDRQLVVTVQDNGIGIAREDLDAVFDTFKQTGDGDGRQKEGLGLGLTLVKQLVELHGGSIAIQSAGRGKGTEVTVQLPLLLEQQVSTADRDPETARGRGKTPLDILIVEDTHASAQMFQRLLESLGHRVRIGCDARQAWQQLRERVPNVVFSDITMPDVDGHEFARQLRENERTKDLFVVAMTGSAAADDVQRALDAGFDYYLSKPADKAELLETLSKIDTPPERPRSSGVRPMRASAD